MDASGDFVKEMWMQYASTLLLKFSVRYVHPNYLFYCFNCVCVVCPNLSSAPCTMRVLNVVFYFLIFCFMFRADSGEEKIVSLEMELKVVGENMKQMEVNIISMYYT